MLKPVITYIYRLIYDLMSVLHKVYGQLKLIPLYFLGKGKGLFVPAQYGIKPGYRHRTAVPQWDDTGYKDEHQKEVYERARTYLDRYGYKKVLDIGCGSGYKLLQNFPDCDTVGVEVGATYDYLTTTYPDRRWIEAGQETQLPRQTDIIICSDVIEHVPDPDSLLQLIGRLDFQLLFLSTPERDLVRGWYSYGPPENFCHIREWNAREFRQYVSTHFEVIVQEITSVKDATQLLICKKKSS